jgi:hypothetical protein
LFSYFKMKISNIFVYSTTPTWKQVTDIRMSRIKDLVREEIINYKEISWEICRLEACNFESDQQANQSTSIKVIMNPSKIQIAVKKKLTDKSIISSTIRVLLNELYWMANDTQLKSAIGTYNTISKLIHKAFLQKMDHLETINNNNNAQNVKPKTTTTTTTNSDELSKVFKQYDIIETSLHLKITLLNVHLYGEDNFSGNEYIDGGAMQFVLKNFCIDHYPYHKLDLISPEHWNNYNPIFKQKESWSQDLISKFVDKIEDVINTTSVKEVNRIRLRTKLYLIEACTSVTLKEMTIFKVTTSMTNKLNKKRFAKKANTNNDPDSDDGSKKVPSFTDLLKTKHFFIEQQTYNSNEFFSSNAPGVLKPDDTLFAHLFFSEFYFSQSECNYPLPSAQLFVHLSPSLLNIDYLTLLWINTLMLSIYKQKLINDKAILNSKSPIIAKANNDDTVPVHCDTYLEIIMPKISLDIFKRDSLVKPNGQSINTEKEDEREKPIGIEIGFTRICLTNDINRDILKEVYQKCLHSSNRVIERSETEFNLPYRRVKETVIEKSVLSSPSMPSIDYKQISKDVKSLTPLAPCFETIIDNENYHYINNDLTKQSNSGDNNNDDESGEEFYAYQSKEGLFFKKLNKNSLNKSALKDLWHINIQNMWLDITVINCKVMTERYTNFIYDTSFQLWFCNVSSFYEFEVEPSHSMISKKIEKKYPLSSHFKAEATEFNKKLNSLSKDVIPFNFNDDNPLQNKKTTRSASTTFTNNNEIVTQTLKMKEDSNNKSKINRNKYSKMNIISNIEKVNVTCNHLQIVFLLRFLDSLDLFLTQLDTDSEQTLKHKENNDNNNNKMNNQNDPIDDKDEWGSAANAAISIDSIQIELNINDYYNILTEKGHKMKTHQSSISTVENSINSTDSTAIKYKINDPMLIKLQNDKDNNIIKDDHELEHHFMCTYVRFLYGLSKDNPTHKTSHASNDNSSVLSINNTTLDSVTSGYGSLRSNSILSFSNNSAMSSSRASLNSPTTTATAELDNVSILNRQLNSDNISLISYSNESVVFANDNLISAESTESLSILDKTVDDGQIKPLKTESVPNLFDESLLNKNLTSSPASTSSLSLTFSLQQQQQQPILTNETIQTIQQTKPILLKISNLNLFMQKYNENEVMGIFVDIQQIDLDGRRGESVRAATSIDNNQQKEILIFFKKEGKINVPLDVKLNNFSLEIETPVLNGIIDIIDDTDRLEKLKPSMPINVSVTNCKFCLNNQFDNKPNTQIVIEKKLFVKMLENDDIVLTTTINDFESSKDDCPNSPSTCLCDYHKSFKNVKNSIEFDKMSLQLSSLVFKLRESNEKNAKLDKRIELLTKQIDEKDKKLKDLEFIVSENAFDIERKQFETLLDQYQQDNENLKNKLKKSEELMTLLNIERDSLKKNLDLKLKK